MYKATINIKYTHIYSIYIHIFILSPSPVQSVQHDVTKEIGPYNSCTKA